MTDVSATNSEIFLFLYAFHSYFMTRWHYKSDCLFVVVVVVVVFGVIITITIIIIIIIIKSVLRATAKQSVYHRHIYFMVTRKDRTEVHWTDYHKTAKRQKKNWNNQKYDADDDDDDARLTAIFRDNLGKPVPECLHLGCYWRWYIVVTSWQLEL